MFSRTHHWNVHALGHQSGWLVHIFGTPNYDKFIFPSSLPNEFFKLYYASEYSIKLIEGYFPRLYNKHPGCIFSYIKKHKWWMSVLEWWPVNQRMFNPKFWNERRSMITKFTLTVKCNTQSEMNIQYRVYLNNSDAESDWALSFLLTLF